MTYPDKDGTWKLNKNGEWIDMAANDSVKYNNGHFGEMQMDTSWANEIPGVVMTGAHSMRQQLIEDQERADRAMRARQAQLHEQVAPTQPKKSVLNKINALVKPKAEEEIVEEPNLRRIKL